MNVFQKTYEHNKKDFDERGMQEYLEFVSVQQVVMTAFLKSIGMSRRYIEFAEKFVETVKIEIRQNKK